MTVRDEMDEFSELAMVRSDLERERKTTRGLTAAVVERDKRIAALTTIEGADVHAPTWAAPKDRKGHKHATGTLMLSDLHLDEVVDPAQVNGNNAYNRDIALLRLRKTFENTVHIAKHYLTGFKYDGFVLKLGGDLVSGNIHDELRETNEGNPIETVDYWVDYLAAGISLLAEEFGHVLIVGVVGNHGRNSYKPRAKNRVTDNFDWLLMRSLVRHFRDVGEKRIEWNIPNSADAYYEVYGRQFALTHGDQAKGGGGISGLATPIAKLDMRKGARDRSAFGSSFEHMDIGHWHTYGTIGAVQVNGSLKGTDEYSWQGNFGHEEPCQAFAVITPEHGMTFPTRIFSIDRSREGW